MLSSSDDLGDRCLPLSGGFFITTTLLSECGGDLWATLCVSLPGLSDEEAERLTVAPLRL